MCTYCFSREHNIRSCDRVLCHSCGNRGHLKRDCRKYRRVNRIRLYFARDYTVRAAVTPTPLRRIPNLGTFLRSLRDLDDTVMGHNQFWSDGNQLNIDYGDQDDILISLQNGILDDETRIDISPARIKVAEKYSILAHELYDDATRSAHGSRNDVDTQAKVHIVLVSEQLFGSTVCLEINETKYYLEWKQNRDVVVQSEHLYQFRRGPPPPFPVRELAEYFLGPQNPPIMAAPVPAVAENAADEIHEAENGQIDRNEIIVVPPVDAPNQNIHVEEEIVAADNRMENDGRNENDEIPAEENENDGQNQPLDAELVVELENRFAIPEVQREPIEENPSEESGDEQLVIDEQN